MRLFGLDALSLSLALLAVSALLVTLYLRKQPLERALVPALSLWLEVLAQESPGKRRLARLRAPLSLLLALAIAALLLGALGDPRLAYEASDQLLLLDRGSSMDARDVSPSRLEAAKREAHAWVDALRPGERAQVLSYADHASVHSALSSERTLLHEAIERVQASTAASEAASALTLVRALRATMNKPALVLFSDGASDHTALSPSAFVRVGESARNVGITQFSARSYPLDGAHAEALITVANFGPASERVALTVSASNVRLHQEVFELAAGATTTRSLPDLPGRALALEASVTLREPDSLALDDHASAKTASRAPRVLLVSEHGDRYLEAALLVDAQLQVTRAPTYADGYDVVIFDRVLPAQGPTVPALYLGPPAQAGAFPLARGASRPRPYFDRLQPTPLLTGLALRDVNITRALGVTPLPSDRVLAASADGTPLLVAGRRAAPFLAITFALPESDLGLRAAFPLLLLRAIDQLSGTSRAVVQSQPSLARSIAPHGVTHAAQHAGIPLLWPLLALAALLLLAFEWLAYQRRWTA